MKQFFRAVAAHIFKLHIPELTDSNRSTLSIIGVQEGHKYLCLTKPNADQEMRIYQNGAVIHADDYSDVLGWQAKSTFKKDSPEAIKAYKKIGEWLLESNFAVPRGFGFIRDHQNEAGYNTRYLRIMKSNGTGAGSFGL